MFYMLQEKSTRKSRRQARVADANERIKNNAALRPAMKLFADGITYGLTKKKASRLRQGAKTILTPVETNRKRH
jgi:hypothetical protein